MWIKKILSILLLFVLCHNCGRAPGEYAGLCAADCSNALIATDNMSIKSLIKTTEIHCNAGQNTNDLHAPFPLRFLIERPVSDIGNDDETSLAGQMLPATAISYDYQVLDGVIDGAVNNFGTSCTDSCGTGLLQLTPVCGKVDNDIRVLIQSGPIAEELTITVKGLSGA